MESEIVDLIVCWLTTFGLAFSMALTDGPFGLFGKARKKVQSTKCSEWIRKGVECPICLSFWAGAGVAFLADGGVLTWLSSFGFVCVVTSLSPE